MALADIRDAIATALLEVPSIGKVNTFDVLTVREEDFKAFFFDKTLGYVLGWCITRELTSEKDRDTGGNWSTHKIVIRGYRALGDGGQTETEFQDLIEAVRTRLRREHIDRLGGVATFVGPPGVQIVEPRMYGSYLVHYAEVVLAVQESIDFP